MPTQITIGILVGAGGTGLPGSGEPPSSNLLELGDGSSFVDLGDGSSNLDLG